MRQHPAQLAHLSQVGAIAAGGLAGTYALRPAPEHLELAGDPRDDPGLHVVLEALRDMLPCTEPLQAACTTLRRLAADSPVTTELRNLPELEIW